MTTIQEDWKPALHRVNNGVIEVKLLSSIIDDPWALLQELLEASEQHTGGTIIGGNTRYALAALAAHRAIDRTREE